MAGYVDVSLLHGGFLTLPEHFFCADQEDKTVTSLVPSMCFLIRHPRTGHNVVFDLGLRKVLADYPPEIRPHLETRQPIRIEPDACDSLRNGGLQPGDIDAVILSHVHYDHVGTPSEFSKAKFVVGFGTRHLLQHGMKYHSAAKFEPDLLPLDRTIELPLQKDPPQYTKPIANDCDPSPGLSTLVDGVEHEWKPLGPFANTIDVFGDGLVYIVDSPGHLVGHLNVLTRVAQNRWVYLAGDACHHKRILDGQAEMATWPENGMRVCIHSDRPVAEETVRRIRKFRDDGGLGGQEMVEVVLAHDLAFWKAHQDAIWPGSYRF